MLRISLMFMFKMPLLGPVDLTLVDNNYCLDIVLMLSLGGEGGVIYFGLLLSAESVR